MSGDLRGARLVTEECEAFAVLTKATREADEAHQSVGGGTRHWLRECFLPSLEAHGLAVVVLPARPAQRSGDRT